MFVIRYKDTENGAYTEHILFPHPTDVEYPERRLFKVRPSKDGANVIQRPLADPRPRQWIWVGYRDSIATYNNQWAFLRTMEYRHRVQNGLYPYVEIWEDEHGENGFGETDGGNKKWTRVKFVKVDRTARKGGGRIVWESSIVEFVIEDEAYEGF
jgi:hypothetical protein